MNKCDVDKIIEGVVKSSGKRQFDILQTWPVVAFVLLIAFNSGLQWNTVDSLVLSIEDLKAELVNVRKEMLHANENVALKAEDNKAALAAHMLWEYGQKGMGVVK